MKACFSQMGTRLMTEQAPLLLALDNGTQSVRAMLFSLRGDLVAKTQIQLEAYVSPQPGWAEHDPEDYWLNLCRACQELKMKHPQDFARIGGASITTQRATIVCTDEEGRALRPAIVWLDKRQVEPPPMTTRAGKAMALASKVIGAGETLDYLRRKAESNWIRTHEPQIWRKTRKVLTLAGYLTKRLVGQFVDSVSCQVGFLPFDYKGLKWPDHYNWRCDAMGITLDKLPKLVQPGTPLGAITEGAAKQSGLPEGLTLFASAGDKACEVLGSGCMQSDIACLSYGTTATVNTTTKTYFEPIALLPSYPAAMPKAYTTEISIYRGYWMVSWFKKEFGLAEVQRAHDLGVTPESLFEALLDETPPGADGLILQPYWSPGIRTPGPEARGGLIGFSDVHTRAHVYRAMLEGIAYGLREGCEHIEKKSGVRVRKLRVSGGGAQSDAALQLTADIFNLPTERPHTYETSGLGAAINVAIGMGLYVSYEAALSAMTRSGEVFQPNPRHVAIYERMYRDVYQPMYDRVKPLYMALRKLGLGR